MISALLLCSLAFAQDPEPDLDFLNTGSEESQDDKVSGDDFSLFDDDEEIPSFEEATAPSAAAPGPTPDLTDIAPLDDAFPLQVVPAGGSLEVELKVLVAQSQSDLVGDYWLVGAVYHRGEEVAEIRQSITAARLVPEGPTLAFVKAQIPGMDAGDVEVRIYKEVAGEREELFRRGANE